MAGFEKHNNLKMASARTSTKSNREEESDASDVTDDEDFGEVDDNLIDGGGIAESTRTRKK